MKKKLTNLLSRLSVDQKKALTVTAVIVLAALIATCASVALFPIALLGFIVYFFLRKNTENAATIKKYEKENASFDTVYNLRQLLAEAINQILKRSGETLPALLVGEVSSEIFIRDGITFYRLGFSLDVLEGFQFGSLNSFHKELQEEFDLLSIVSRFRIPTYLHGDGRHILEEPARIYALSTTDKKMFVDIFVVEDAATYALYDSMPKTDFEYHMEMEGLS